MSLENGEPRNATGVALDGLELLRISKKDYTEIFAGIMLQERLFKKELILHAFPEVGDSSAKDLTSITYKMKEVNVAKGDFLYKEGDRYEKVFILVSGTIGVKKKLDTEFLSSIGQKISSGASAIKPQCETH